MDFEQRYELIAAEPDVYYLKGHYVGYPCVLVRLSRIHPDALRDILGGARRLVIAQEARRKIAMGQRREHVRNDGVATGHRSERSDTDCNPTSAPIPVGIRAPLRPESIYARSARFSPGRFPSTCLGVRLNLP